MAGTQDKTFFCSIGPRGEIKGSSKHQYVLFLLFSMGIGALTGLGVYVFRWMIIFFREFFWGYGDNIVSVVTAAPWWWRLIIPTAAGLAVGPIITFIVPEARGPGVPEIIKAISKPECVIRHKVSLLKALITSLLIGAGASVGREGPIVQIGGSVGSSLAQLFRLNPNLRPVCLAVGAAAGISAAFNAPLAGAIFAIEVILVDLEVAYISHIIVASAVGSLIARTFWGELPYLDISAFSLNYSYDLPLFLLLGVLSGLLSIVFIRSLDLTEKLFNAVPLPQWIKPGLGGLCLGLLALWLPDVMGVGYHLVNTGLAGQFALSMALLLLCGKLAATSLCIGSGMSGGIFAPSLCLGVTLGSVLCLGIKILFPDAALSPASFALVGMGAVVGGTTLAPLTAVVTIFELTASYKVILPMLLACISSSMIVRLLYGYSAYERKLIKQGISIVRGHFDNPLRYLKASDLMEKDFPFIRADDTLEKVLCKAVESSYPHFVVLDKAERLAGIIGLRDLKDLMRPERQIPDATPASHFMTTKVCTISADGCLEEALQVMDNHHISCMPVVDPDHPEKVLGILKKDDVIHAYRDKSWKSGQLSGIGN